MAFISQKYPFVMTHLYGTRSPAKTMTLAQLTRLREMDYCNADTGREYTADECEQRFWELMDRKVNKLDFSRQCEEPMKSEDCPFDFFNEPKDRYKMSVTIKDMDSSPESSPSSISKEIENSLNIAEIMQRMNQDIQIATGEAVEKAMTYADNLSRDIITKVKEQISGIAKPKVMAVEIDKVQRKLSKPANKHLGRMIINHGLGIHTMLVGPAGCGKTIAAGQLAEATGKQFGSMCLSAGASETWLFGRQTGNGFIEGSFAKIYKEGGIYLLDEMDAADSNFLLAVNTALANGFMTNPMNGEVIHQHKDFVCIAGANTFGMGSTSSYTGRNRLDGATLTRFVKIAVDYDPEIEEAVCPDEELRGVMQNARKVIQNERMDYIVSTRCLDYAYRQKAAGISVSDILASLTMGWPEELIKKSGIADFTEAKAEKRVSKKKTSSEFMPATAGELF